MSDQPPDERGSSPVGDDRRSSPRSPSDEASRPPDDRWSGPPAQQVADDDWQRLDPRMLLVHPVREVVRFLPPLLGLFVAGQASGGGAWQFLGVVVPVALGLLRYLTTSFRITGGRVELRRGLLTRHVLSTPLDRVRTVDLTASPVHRVLGLTTLRIGTGNATAGEDDGLDLDGLPAEHARRLRASLLRAAVADAVRPDDADAPVTGAAPDVEPVVALDLAWLRYAPLTSSGVVVAAGLLGVGSQVLSGLGVSVDLGRGDLPAGLPGAGVVAAGIVLFVLLVAAISVAGYAVTNWDFRLTRADGSWHLRRGLLTTRETSLDEERVAGVSLAEPLGLRLAGAARLSAVVTGLGADQETGSLLVPPAPRDVVTRVAGVVLGTAAPATVALVPHGPAARRRRLVRAVGPVVVLLGLVLAAVVLADVPAWTLALPGVLLLPAAALGADRAAALGHALVDGHLVARSGSLTRRRDHLRVDDVIGWNLRATWFQRRAGLTSLVATTAGGRQAVTVHDVPTPLATTLTADALPHVVRQFLA